MKGTVQWFDDGKGYGFIAPDDGGKDVFVHFSGVIGTGRRSLADGARVEYETQDTPRGPTAVNVVVLD